MAVKPRLKSKVRNPVSKFYSLNSEPGRIVTLARIRERLGELGISSARSLDMVKSFSRELLIAEKQGLGRAMALAVKEGWGPDMALAVKKGLGLQVADFAYKNRHLPVEDLKNAVKSYVRRLREKRK